MTIGPNIKIKLYRWQVQFVAVFTFAYYLSKVFVGDAIVENILRIIANI